MTQGTLFKERYPARARRSDPIQSDMAADKVTPNIKYQWMKVLRALKVHGICTAKHLDHIMPTANLLWDGRGHRRMPELARMGLVHRQEKDENGRPLPQMLCSITEKGKRLLDGI